MTSSPTSPRAPAPRAVTDDRDSRRRELLLLLLISLAVGTLGTWIFHTGPRFLVCDEFVHREAILSWAAGDLGLHPRMAMLPGYHALIALAVELGADGLLAMRLVSLALGLISVALVHAIAVEVGGARPFRTSLLVLFLPWLFPYRFLLYTDGLSLTVVLGCMLCALRRRLLLTAALGLCAVLIRQNNLIWLLFVCAVTSGGEVAASQLRSWLTRLAPLSLALPALGAFALITGSLVAGDARVHGGLYPENICLSGALFALLLPDAIARPAIWRALFGWRLPVLLAALLLTWLGLEGVESYNGAIPEQSPLSRLALEVSQPGLARLVYLGVVAAGWIALGGARFVCTSWRGPLLSCWVLYMLPLASMSPRYQVIPLTLFLIARRPGEDRLEVVRAGGWVVLSFGFLLAIAYTPFIV